MQFTFKILTYGCKVNQYESQSIREYWQSLGGVEVFDENIPQPSRSTQYSDFILLSGCAVTAQGVSDARQMVRKLLRDMPKSYVIVTGCAASAEPDDFNFENVIACISQTAKWNLLYCHPRELVPSREQAVSSDGICCKNNDFTLQSFQEKNREFPEFSINNFERSRPVLKIQDGCSHGCSYCIVPLTRGKARSRKPEESLAEFSRLVKKGFREIVISGINLRQYSAEKENFWGFLRRLHKHVKNEYTIEPLPSEVGQNKHLTTTLQKLLNSPIRIRLSSLEPSQINSEGLETLAELAENSFLCPHLHLSLQSGSESVLKRMGREHYAPETIIEIMEKVRTFWPTFALGADFLMGFAGESEVELQETLDLVEVLPLTYAHVFPYSIRKGTKAALIKDQLDKKNRQEHARKVRECIDIKKKKFMQSMLGLESMHVSLDCLHANELDENNIKLQGWNEFYVSCQVFVEENMLISRKEQDSHFLPKNTYDKKNIACNASIIRSLATSHELLRVKPIKIVGDKLVTSLF